ncbi:hypothetical protein HMPREF0973_01184 [Prevotella veroralis F0319]|uniref:Uncharacterized protein n=1 Tax=Prevotella veroralis F0319 TaxID=649761 RepID=C9MNJ7_9BACT|nr:hypothetical protein HMPREF0973_01184 [Prevotella veroralis F0319]
MFFFFFFISLQKKKGIMILTPASLCMNKGINSEIVDFKG